MLSAFLFGFVVFIWGTTWYAITFQIGEISVFVSVFYRFALSAFVMIGALLLLGKLHRPANWRFVIVQALCLFCFNYLSFYQSTTYMPSGLVAVIFSLASLFNAVNGRLFYRETISLKIFGAAGLGLSGVALLFWEDLIIANSMETFYGVMWAVLGTLLFSFGNMASRRNTIEGTSPLCANTWGMGIGSGVLLILVLVQGHPLTLPEHVSYWAALFYLSVIGTVIAFWTYLNLVQRIGSVRAGYATVLFPVIALLISTFYEGYIWTQTAFLGLGLIMVGNLVMFVPDDYWSRLKKVYS